jgi:hypothetical protein
VPPGVFIFYQYIKMKAQKQVITTKPNRKLDAAGEVAQSLKILAMLKAPVGVSAQQRRAYFKQAKQEGGQA